MATGPSWINEATLALISIWGKSNVQSKLDSKNNHLLSLLREAIRFIASYTPISMFLTETTVLRKFRYAVSQKAVQRSWSILESNTHFSLIQQIIITCDEKRDVVSMNPDCFVFYV